MRAFRIDPALVVFGSVLLLLCGSTSATSWGSNAFAAPTPVQPQRAPVIGDVAPEITGLRIQGGDPVNLSQLQGRVVVLDFWATWCGPCRAIMPILDRMHDTYRARGLSVLGLSGEDQATVRRHLGAQRYRYTIASGARSSMATYGVNALPMLVVVDRAGKVRHVARGASLHQLQELDRLVQQLLAERVP